MPLEIPPGFAHVVHSYKLVGDPEPMATTYGVEAEELTFGDLNTLAQQLHNLFSTTFMPFFSVDYQLQQTEVTSGATLPAVGAMGLFVGAIDGSSTSAALPQNCSILMHKRSGLAGRRHRGRMFLPPVGEGNVAANGVVLASTVAALTTAGGTFLSSIAGSTTLVRMVILHTEGVSATPAPTPVSQLICDPVLGTQRRRLR